MTKRFAKIFLVTAFIVTISSCEKKSCKNVVCPAGQACNSGRCYCADGYEGSNCDQYAYEKYVWNNYSWHVSESCYGGSSNFSNYYTYFQQYSSNPSEIHVNLLNSNCDVTAYIRTDQSNLGNIIEIPNQNCGGITISGQGSYYSSPYIRIVFELNYTFNGNSYQCTETFQ